MGRYRPPSPKSSPYITREGYDTLKAEEKALWLRRRDVTAAVSAAAAEGDRSENAEYIYRKKSSERSIDVFDTCQAHTGAVTLIQRFGSALNLNLHFHVLFIDGIFSPKNNGNLRFHRVNAPTSKELNTLVATISERVARYLERRGRLARVGWPETNRAII